jgi:hypothetical protein
MMENLFQFVEPYPMKNQNYSIKFEENTSPQKEEDVNITKSCEIRVKENNVKIKLNGIKPVYNNV